MSPLLRFSLFVSMNFPLRTPLTLTIGKNLYIIEGVTTCCSSSVAREGGQRNMSHAKKVKLTRGTKRLIEQAIRELEPEKRNNRIEICARIAQILEERFDGDNLTYQLKRMDLQTTGKILEKIDTYWYKYGKRIDEILMED